MRYLILTDLHANLPALEAVLADAATLGYDQTLILGDLVGYGADPGAVIERTIELKPAGLIRGNHDKVCAGLETPALFNDIARASIEWTMEAITPAQLKFLADLPQGPRLVTEAIEICHGSPFDEDYYLFDEDDAERALDTASARICLFGHTHVPAVYLASAPPDTSLMRGDALTLPVESRALVNVGAVGQPRDGDPRAAYGLLDTADHVLRLRRVVYDVAAEQRRILDAGLPFWLAARLERGQ